MPVSNVLDRVKVKFDSASEKSRLEPATMRRRKKMFYRWKDVCLVGERRVAGRTTFKNLEPSKCYLLSQTDVVPSATQLLQLKQSALKFAEFKKIFTEFDPSA